MTQVSSASFLNAAHYLPYSGLLFVNVEDNVAQFWLAVQKTRTPSEWKRASLKSFAGFLEVKAEKTGTVDNLSRIRVFYKYFYFLMFKYGGRAKFVYFG